MRNSDADTDPVEAGMLTRSRLIAQRMARPEALGLHFDLGLRAYEQGDASALKRHRTAIALLPEGGADAIEYLALDWRVRWLADQFDEALAIAEAITGTYPDDADAWLELGQILVDMDRGEDALAALSAGTERSHTDPDLWYEVGVVAERVEQWELRKDAFLKVWELEQDLEPARRLFLSEHQFTRTVEQTLERLPPMAQKAIGNVAVIIENYPERWVVEDDGDPRILGLFDGADHASDHMTDVVSDGPARIYLFRWNIERTCATQEEAEEQVAITVLHEVGHYLGLDEEALHFLGLG